MKKSYYKKRSTTNMNTNMNKTTKTSKTNTNINTSNTPYLVIVESPSKCLKIENFLGFQYKCIASKGHLREIKKVHNAKKEYAIDFQYVPEKIAHIQWMKSIIMQFLPQHIFLGTDDDREGEAIAWHICEIFDLSVENTKRILFHEVTAPALKQAVANPTTIRMNIVKAQHARQILDRMIGFQISPVLSRLLVHDNTKYLSAGRCQTPTLRLIYDRHKEFASKKERVQYKIVGKFLQHPNILTAPLDVCMESEVEIRNFLEHSKTFPHTLSMREKTAKTTAPPKPFSTSHLLQTASSLLHMSPKYTMDACQKLYQDGKITYMRTESQKYAQAFLDQTKMWIETKFGQTYLGNLEKVAHTDNKNPHEAIRVTKLDITYTDYQDKRTNDLYKLIWRRSIESCMSPYQYESSPVIICAPISQYSCVLDVPLFLGWKRLGSTLEEMRETQMKMSTQVEYIKKFIGRKVPYQKIESTLFMKDLEAYYQEASIIQKLESLGIGRPSTYSMLVETIQERKYVQKQDIEGETFTGNELTLEHDGNIQMREISKVFGASKNKLKIQELGIQAIDVLLQHFEPLFDYSYTSKMEADLDELMTQPDKSLVEICQTCETSIQECLKPMKELMKKTYWIDNDHQLVFGKSGMMIKHIKENEILETTKHEYKSLKPNLEIDFQKLERKEYKLEDLIELPNDCLGTYFGESMYLKNGPYGAYVVWGANKQSLAKYTKKMALTDITMSMVQKWLAEINSNDKAKSKILREITPGCSLRKGDYGHYIYYKTDAMKKPTFVNIKKCKLDLHNAEPDLILKWVEESLTK